MVRRVFVVFAFLWAASARGGAWYRIPVLGADVASLAVDPEVPGLVFCGTSRGNVYVSRDGGATWRTTRPGNAFPGYIVSALVPDAHAPGRLWAALSGSDRGALVAVSEDRGKTWKILARWDRSVDARALAQSGADPDRLACGGDDGVFLSTDGGRSWEPSGAGVPGLRLVQSLAFDPADPRTLYAGTYRQAFRTTDGGATWERIADGMVLDATVYSFAFSESDPASVWVSTCGWVYHSPDRGSHWTRYTSGFTNRRTPIIRIDPLAKGVIYAGTVGGLHRSDDGGRTWKRISRETLDVSALAVDSRSGRLYVGTLGDGMFYSDDRGSKLQPASDGLEEARVPALAPDPANPSRVLFLRAYGGSGSGVWEAVDGTSRQISADAPPGASDLAATGGPAGTVWLCASASRLLVSRDGGAHFTPPESPPPGGILRVLGAPLKEGIVVTDRGVFQTRDGERFAPVRSISGTPASGRIVRASGGEPELEVQTSEGVFLGDAREFHNTGRRLLGGGVFFRDRSNRAEPYFRFDFSKDEITLWKGNESATLMLPRAALAVSDAAIAGDGSLYVATMGDGLFRYRPDSQREPAGSGRVAAAMP